MPDERQMRDVVAIYRNGKLEMIAVKDEERHSVVDITDDLRALLAKSDEN